MPVGIWFVRGIAVEVARRNNRQRTAWETCVQNANRAPFSTYAFQLLNLRFYFRRPVAALGLFLLAHLLIWTLTPVLVHTGMPMDVVEGYAIGREWVIGTFKHPAMPSWLLEISRIVTRKIGWPAYLLSSICVVATYATVFLLARDMLDIRRAVASSLLLSGVLYFSWVTPEFNHNVLQMPFWAGTIFALWRARETSSESGSETGSNRWWAILGALAAGGMYAKFSTAVLLVVVLAYILVDAKCRANLGRSGPWVALGVFLVLMTPMVNWLVDTKFQLLDYAEARATGGRAGSVILFLWKQIASSTGLFVLLALASLHRPWKLPLRRITLRQPQALKITADADRFIAVFFLGPIALMAFGALFSGVGLKGSWGTSILSLAGIAAIIAAGKLQIALALHRITAGAIVLLAVIPAGYAISVKASDRFSKSPPRVAWPQDEIARRLQKIWRQRTGMPLRIVAGDLWIGGMVAAKSTDRPSLLIDGDLARSPWLNREMIEKHGALIVAWWRQPMASPLQFPHVKALGVEGTEIFHVNFGRQGRDLPVYYAIVPPGTKMKSHLKSKTSTLVQQ